MDQSDKNANCNKDEESKQHVKKLEFLLKKVKERVPIEVQGLDTSTQGILSIEAETLVNEDINQAEWENEQPQHSLLEGNSNVSMKKLEKYDLDYLKEGPNSSEEEEEEESEETSLQSSYKHDNSDIDPDSDSDPPNFLNNSYKDFEDYTPLDEYNESSENEDCEQPNNSDNNKNNYQLKYRKYMLSHLYDEVNSSLEDLSDLKDNDKECDVKSNNFIMESRSTSPSNSLSGSKQIIINEMKASSYTSFNNLNPFLAPEEVESSHELKPVKESIIESEITHHSSSTDDNDSYYSSELMEDEELEHVFLLNPNESHRQLKVENSSWFQLGWCCCFQAYD